jgi:Uma2 family endonuclease
VTDQVVTRITQEDLQRLDAEDKWVEVVDGEIVEGEHEVTFLHLIIIQNLYDILKPYVAANKLGSVFMDGARYILAGSPQDIRRAHKPDFSYLRAGRIPPDFDWTGDFAGAPDFAVEVASPGQTNTILLPRIASYLQAGTEEAWLIYPWRKELYQYRRDAEVPATYQSTDTIDTSALFPGLNLVVKDFSLLETVEFHLRLLQQNKEFAPERQV